MNLLDRNLNHYKLNSKTFISLSNEIHSLRKSIFSSVQEYKNLSGNINLLDTINSFPEILVMYLVAC